MLKCWTSSCNGLQTAVKAAQCTAAWAPRRSGLWMERPPRSAFLHACHMSSFVRRVAVVIARAFWSAAQTMVVLSQSWRDRERSKSKAQATQRSSKTTATWPAERSVHKGGGLVSSGENTKWDVRRGVRGAAARGPPEMAVERFDCQPPRQVVRDGVPVLLRRLVEGSSW